MKQRYRPGDIFQVRQGKHFAYLQYLSDKHKYCDIVRVFDKVFDHPVDNFESMTTSTNWWMAFMNVRWEASTKGFRPVAHLPLPRGIVGKPIFKFGIRNLQTGRVYHWTIMAGPIHLRQRVACNKLTKEQRKYPIWEILHADEVLPRLRAHWSPEVECDGPAEAFRWWKPIALVKRASTRKVIALTPKIDLFDNDAACDFFCAVSIKGWGEVKRAIKEIARIALREDLERDDSNVVIAILALLLEKSGNRVPAAEKALVEDAVKACRRPPDRKLIVETLRLAKMVGARSELRELWNEEGKLKAFSSRLKQLIDRYESVYEVDT